MALRRCVLTTPAGAAASAPALLPNALAALHNCSLLAAAAERASSQDLAEAVLPLLETSAAGAGRAPVLYRRAAAVLAKCAARHAAVVERLLRSPVLPTLVATLVAEGKAAARR